MIKTTQIKIQREVRSKKNDDYCMKYYIYTQYTHVRQMLIATDSSNSLK